MIKRKTTLVLGAGASCAYGFPSGAKLRTQILDYRNTPENKERAYALQTTPEEYEEFGRAFGESALLSIDSFLAKQAERRKRFYELGKKAVAFYVGRCEDPQLLRERHSEKDDWYRLLWNALAGDAQTLDEVPRDLVQVVTFNYDRSLEYFLFLASKAAFALEDKEAIQFIEGLQIRHVYGSLGPLTSKEAKEGHPYRQLKLDKDVAKAATSIQIVERAKSANVVADWQDWLKTADQICFLGFGFDSLNIERIGFADSMAQRFVRQQNGQVHGKGLTVYATVRGIPEARIQQIRSELLRLPPEIGWEPLPADICDALPAWNCLR